MQLILVFLCDESAMYHANAALAEEERGSWLNEADFLTGGGPSETEDKEGASAQDQSEVQVCTHYQLHDIPWDPDQGAYSDTPLP